MMRQAHFFSMEIDDTTSNIPVSWEDDVVPLLMQGFRMQAVNAAGSLFKDQEPFQITQDRGVVIGLDYVAGNLAQYVNGVTEDIWCDARIWLKGGGVDLLVGEPAERYDYGMDLGTDEEKLIHTRLAGGQVLNSTLALSTTSGSTLSVIAAQLIAYYSTKRLEDWKKTLSWKAGTGLKRQSFLLEVPQGTTMTFSLDDILPKNQGPIIGVSFLAMSAEIFNWHLDFYINGIQVIDNVNCLRFSRKSQREPYILLYPFQAGSKFKATLNLQTLISSNDGAFAVTFYFDN